jgi:nucleoside phosphorylase
MRLPSLVCAVTLSACGTPAGQGDAGVDAGTYLAVFSAFSAEAEVIKEQMTVESTQMFNGYTFRLGTIGGVKVVAGMTGMGLDNARATSHAVLNALPIRGVIFSGVAGSSLRIADVVVPAAWSLDGGSVYPTDTAWLALTKDLTPCFGTCTITSGGVHACLDHVPSLTTGGTGDSTKIPVVIAFTGTDNVFACDAQPLPDAGDTCQPMGPFSGDAGMGPITVDNETAAVAAEAQAKSLPFIGFRGVSDGADDPLGLPGYPSQFFAWYRLAARNAGSAAAAFVQRVGAATP